jgi:DNA-binding Lrp family transcriptional regulator
LTLLFLDPYNGSMLDEIDRKIILALRQNGRTSNKDLADRLGLGVTAISKRIDKILSENIVTIQAVINPYKMGYKANAFIVLDVDLRKENSVSRKLMDNPNVSLIVTAFGRFDMILIVDFEDWTKLDNFIKKELSQIDGVNKVDTFLLSEIKKRYQGIFDNNIYSDYRPDLDDIDQNLIKELRKDGRTSYAVLADKLGIGIATVSRRINALIKSEIIKIIAVPNPSKLGDNANAFIGLNVDLKEKNRICDELSKEKVIYLVMTMVNGFDIIVGAALPKPELLNRYIIDKIAYMPGVINLETFVRAEIIKATYARLEFIPEE